METIKYVIIDDDELLHNELLVLMKKFDNFECVAHFYDGLDAKFGLQNLYNIELLFLDMELGNSYGFEILKSLKKDYKTIIISSHTDYSLESYEYSVIDYLTKPIRPLRLSSALDKVAEQIKNEQLLDLKKRNFSEGIKDHIIVSVISTKRKQTISIFRNEIYYVIKNGNYCNFVTYTNNTFTKYISLKHFMKELTNELFLFVNKSMVVNINSAYTIDGESIKIDNNLYLITSKDKSRFKKINT